jgi:hypothetical protein
MGVVVDINDISRIFFQVRKYLRLSCEWRHQIINQYLVTSWLPDLLARIFTIDKTPIVAIILAKDSEITQPISSDIQDNLVH